MDMNKDAFLKTEHEFIIVIENGGVIPITTLNELNYFLKRTGTLLDGGYKTDRLDGHDRYIKVRCLVSDIEMASILDRIKKLVKDGIHDCWFIPME